MFKRPVLRPPIKVIGYCRFSTFYFQPFLPDRDDTIQLRERQRIKQERIDHTEDRCICADPQRQRDHGNQSEAWFLHQHSSAVAQVLPQFFKPSHATSVAAPLDSSPSGDSAQSVAQCDSAVLHPVRARLASCAAAPVARSSTCSAFQPPFVGAYSIRRRAESARRRRKTASRSPTPRQAASFRPLSFCRTSRAGCYPKPPIRL